MSEQNRYICFKGSFGIFYSTSIAPCEIELSSDLDFFLQDSVASTNLAVEISVGRVADMAISTVETVNGEAASHPTCRSAAAWATGRSTRGATS